MEKFKEKLINDNSLLSRLNVLPNYIENEEVLDKIYDLCRLTFLTQYNAEIMKTEEKTFQYVIPHADFAVLGDSIKSFLNHFEEAPEIIFDELIEIFKSYYRMTAKREETINRTHAELQNNNSSLGTVGTLYDFNRIDWNYFLKGLKDNM